MLVLLFSALGAITAPAVTTGLSAASQEQIMFLHKINRMDRRWFHR